ncbi:MAG: hypothetical protein NWE89_17210 [Candidatus Bathyarchaeota archaeon]|nr:hypothetical protein [Candidatus Bathyarchaeota archaeon]
MKKFYMNVKFNDHAFKICEERFDLKKNILREKINNNIRTYDLKLSDITIRYYLSSLNEKQYVLILTTLHKDCILIHSAYRILSNFINKYNEKDLRLILLQFILNFGLQFKIGKNTEILIQDKEIKVNNENEILNPKVINPENHSWMQNLIVKKLYNNQTIYHIALYFFIDLNKYSDWLNEGEEESFIEISNSIRGLISKRDLLNPSIFMIFKSSFQKFYKSDRGDFITVSSPKYNLSIGFSENNELYIKKNEYKISYPLDNFKQIDNSFSASFLIRPNELSIIVVDENTLKRNEKDESILYKEHTKSVKTPTIFPPNHLIEWAQKNDILQVETYSDSHHFFEVVVDSLLSIQDKIKRLGSVQAFWNTKMKNQPPYPKKEHETLPTIRMILQDISIAKNYEIIPEYKISAGSLDFLFLGILKSKDMGKVCVEFKNAHSTKLKQGLTKQLPRYMKSKGCDLGIYCVLYYKGKYFNKPKKYDATSLSIELEKLKIQHGLHDVRIVFLDLSYPEPPSLLK